MNMLYHWEVQPVGEVEPYIIFTERDSVGDAARRFEEFNGRLSIRHIRKVAIVENFEYDEVLDEFVEVS